jgi:hypothetical protein
MLDLPACPIRRQPRGGVVKAPVGILAYPSDRDIRCDKTKNFSVLL